MDYILGAIKVLVIKTATEIKPEFVLEVREDGENAKIYGHGGIFDSLDLVVLVINLEQVILDKLEMSIKLANEKAMSQTNSPFLTVNSLANYIFELYCDESNIDSVAPWDDLDAV